MKYKYYVGIIKSEGGIRYVTKCSQSTKIALWQDGEKALPMTLSAAKDLVFGLRCNCYNAVVITAPDYETFFNPAPEEWFGIVRWCDEDVETALIDNGYEPTPEAVALIKADGLATALTDYGVQSGWDVFESIISQNSHKLTRREED